MSNRWSSQELAERPTGIIRTAPIGGIAYKNMLRGLEALNTDDDALFYFGLAQKPRIEVLHFYILTGGRIIGRCNIAEWLTEQPQDMELCDEEWNPSCKYWAVLTAPFTRPPEPIYRKGFQGFRYTDTLW